MEDDDGGIPILYDRPRAGKPPEDHLAGDAPESSWKPGSKRLGQPSSLCRLNVPRLAKRLPQRLQRCIRDLRCT